MYRVAVSGNPNCGKTCIFNDLTGSAQRVGNYPGVTVDFVSGESDFCGERVKVVDLPGTYSLTAYSQEEVVARNFIVDEKPDVIINVVDASSLERNLYLTVQLIELDVPLVIALNMVDVAEKKGISIDERRLSEILGVEVVKTIATRKVGIEELKAACIRTAREQTRPHRLSYSHELNMILPSLEKVVAGNKQLCGDFPVRWIALKLLEDDEIICARLAENESAMPIRQAVRMAKEHLYNHSHEESVTSVIEARYGIASGAMREVTSFSEQARQMFTDVIDSVVCHRFLGVVILCAVVFMLFTFVFKLADELKWIPLLNGEWLSPTGVLNLFFNWLSGQVTQWVSVPWVESLLNDGIINGVGGVMSFVPLIFFMFLFISALEDSGYVARVAFILDRVLKTFGLQGKSILALIVSGGLGAGGCAVPGVMATRTLREENDRLVTILVAPFMNCGAKLPVYAMLIAAFFSNARGTMMFLIWLLSWCFALGSAYCLRRWVIKGRQTPFVMELPVYHLPTLRGILMDTWHRTWLYIKKAATIILAINIILWALMYFPRLSFVPFQQRIERLQKDSHANPEQLQKKIIDIKNEYAGEQLRNSFAGRAGEFLVPLSRLAGFDWRDNIALIGGFAAKEVVLGTLGTAYAMGKDGERQPEMLARRLAANPHWNGLRAFVLMVFVMSYAPCLVTVAAIKKETGKWKWAIFATVYSTIVAFVVAAVIYQVGLLFMS